MAVFWNYWFCTQDLFLVLLTRPHEMPGIKPESTTNKASAFNTLSL